MTIKQILNNYKWGGTLEEAKKLILEELLKALPKRLETRIPKSAYIPEIKYNECLKEVEETLRRVLK